MVLCVLEREEELKYLAIAKTFYDCDSKNSLSKIRTNLSCTVVRFLLLTCNFLCVLQPPQPETQETSDDEIIKTPEPKEWVSLGSEREVDEESVKESKKVQRHTLYMYVKSIFHSNLSAHGTFYIPFFCYQMSYRFSRVRRKFGEPVCFSDRNAADVRDGLVECVSYQDSRFNIRLMQRDCGMQAIPKVDSSSSQTQRYASKSEHN